MPSPFPGMDPYLENPDVFPNLHDKLIVHLEEAIQPLLPEPYYAKGSQRIWLEFQEASRIPDVSVLSGSRPSAPVPDEGGGVAVVDVPVKITAPYERPWHEHHETFLEIYTKAVGGPRLVTAIEVLSPTNKSPGHSRSAYHNKQGEWWRGRRGRSRWSAGCPWGRRRRSSGRCRRPACRLRRHQRVQPLAGVVACRSDAS
jgi:hypothetical protein